MTELFDGGIHLNATQKTKQPDHPIRIWIAALVILLTFLVLDAGALAWSASLAGGRQILVEIFTFFVVLSGTAITVWKMKVG